MAHELSTRLVTLVGHDSSPFEEIFAVEDSAVLPKGIKIIAQLKPAIAPKTYEFHLDKAVEIVKSDSTLVMLQSQDKTISRENVEVEQMVKIVLGELDNLIGVALPKVTQEQYRKIVTKIFIHLKSPENEEWFHITSPKVHSTTYQYNITFIIQNEETGWLFYVIPMGLTIKVDLEMQKLFSVKLKDKVTYNIHVKALKIGAKVGSTINNWVDEVAS
jgi:hypothetical protein